MSSTNHQHQQAGTAGDPLGSGGAAPTASKDDNKTATTTALFLQRHGLEATKFDPSSLLALQQLLDDDNNDDKKLPPPAAAFAFATGGGTSNNNNLGVMSSANNDTIDIPESATETERLILKQLQQQNIMLLQLQQQVQQLQLQRDSKPIKSILRPPRIGVQQVQQEELQQRAALFHGRRRPTPPVRHHRPGTPPPNAAARGIPPPADAANAAVRQGLFPPVLPPARPQHRQQQRPQRISLRERISQFQLYLQENYRIFKVLRLFLELRRRMPRGQLNNPLDFFLIIKILFMGTILLSRVKNSNNVDNWYFKIYLTAIVAIVGLLIQSGYALFLYQFFVQHNFAWRIYWHNEDITVEMAHLQLTQQGARNQGQQRGNNNAAAPGAGVGNANAANAAAPRQRNADPAQQAADNGGGGQEAPAAAAADAAPQQGGGDPLAFLPKILQDVVIFFGSFILSVFPMWRMAMPQNPQQQQQQQQPANVPQQQQPNDGPDAIPQVQPPVDPAGPLEEDDDDNDDEE